MLALEPLIQERLRALPVFTGWQVRGGTVATDRRGVPGVDVRMAGASVAQLRKPAVSLQPLWVVSLVVQRGDGGADQLGGALVAVIGSLHNWRPEVAGRSWTELQVAGVSEAQFSDSGFAGYEITFTTVAVFDGQP